MVEDRALELQEISHPRHKEALIDLITCIGEIKRVIRHFCIPGPHNSEPGGKNKNSGSEENGSDTEKYLSIEQIQFSFRYVFRDRTDENREAVQSARPGKEEPELYL